MDRNASHGVDGLTVYGNELRLLGCGSFGEFLDFVRDETEGGRAADEGEHADAWRDARAHYARLAEAEAGIADQAELHALPPGAQPWIDRLIADPVFQAAHAVVPVAFGLVELDKLVVFQRDLSISHAPRVQAELGSERSLDDLLRVCLPLDRALADVSLCRTGADSFLAHSPSLDLRFLGAELASPGQVSGLAETGPVAGYVVLKVGFGVNHLSVLRFGTRMVLMNGYHRAYALRALGVTHVPAVIQVVSDAAELELVAGGEVTDDPAALFEAPRPALFKDFFEPALSRVYRTANLRKQVHLSVKADTLTYHA